MRFEIDTQGRVDGAAADCVIKMYPENNREMRDLDFIFDRYSPPYMEKVHEDEAIYYAIQFADNLKDLMP